MNRPIDGDHPWRDGGAIVDEGEWALRDFGGERLSRGQAGALLAFWQRRPELTDREVGAILDRFGAL